jgi:ssDNA-specific exonuclease RecJ
MGYYLKRGNRIDVYASDSIDIGQKLEAKVYAVNEDLHGIYLSTIPDMDVPSKLYG